MSTPENTISLRSTRALAHSLYCECQRQLNAYRPISKSIRSLRNKLEEADELLDEATYRSEDHQVLQAASASKEVLERLKLALQNHSSTTQKANDPDESFIIEFLEQIDSVTQRLNNAVTTLEEQTGTLELMLDTSILQRTLSPGIPSSISSVSREHWKSPSAVSELHSVHPDHVSVSDSMSLRHEEARSPDRVGKSSQKESILPQTSPDPQVTVQSSPPTNPPSRPDSASTTEPFYKGPFFDPLSIDIDQASHMILGLEASEPSTRVDSGIIYGELEKLSATPAENNDTAPESIHTSTPHVASQCLNSGVEQRKEDGLQKTSPLPVEANRDDRTGRLGVKQETNGPAQRQVSPLSKNSSIEAEELKSNPKEQTTVVESAESCEAGDVGIPMPPTTTKPIRLPQRYLSSRLGKLKRPSRPPESRYRIVNDTETTPAENSGDDGAASKRRSHVSDPGVVRRPHSPAEPTTYIPKSGLTAREPRANSDSTKDIAGFLRSTGPAQGPVIYHNLGTGTSQAPPQQQKEAPWNPEDIGARAPSIHSPVWTAADSGLTTRTSTPINAMQSSASPPSLSIQNDDENLANEQTYDVHGEQNNNTVRIWNSHAWDDAEKLLENRLAQVDLISDYQLARRIRHLLGVTASLKGEWHRALVRFMSVLNTPITAASQLDPGDCAAAYWAGDIYALLDRRSEALLAYSIAERGPLFQDASRPRLHQCIRAEQEACRSGAGKGALKQDGATADSILNVKIITSGAADSFLSYVRWQPSAQDIPYIPDPHDRRSVILWKLGLESDSDQPHINASTFDVSSPWPLSFDPLFTMANVSQGSLIQECNLLQIFTSNPGTKIAKSGGLRGKSDCFTHPDVRWLIITIRNCLKQFPAVWSESTNAQSTWFAARYPCTEEKIATINYFSITIFKLSFRSGYGVEICPGGVCSARITRTDPMFEKGVHRQETKRIKSLAREYLEMAARKQEAISVSNTALPVMGINGGMYRDPGTANGGMLRDPGSRTASAVRYA